ncbi:uncharacterized protein BHQ10_005367 [Talaromyces amestolkiae]|uniref:EthD domain-containing protein n=1 Tax=Talaromyces amestolkiae TaxID=1196081 RepID=A0A364L0N4_TALAM|nr:uncharacterized protein BHQ10_005367 [Talaromyces amestolkiae]RAO69355.1 hypothetical protein BHQ10_005367 [Talaromyces amestolkiae]
MASARITKQLLLRLSIYNYKAESKSEEETHNNYHSPSYFQEIIQNLNTQDERGLAIDDRDFVVKFYFHQFEEVAKFTLDPEFKAMQQEKEPWVSKYRIVTSLGWVENLFQDGKVVNIQDGIASFPDFVTMTDLSTPGSDSQ